jgi:hypothetical protein
MCLKIPMVGSGTSVEVAREMGIEAHGFDLHSGFNILKDAILEAVGKPSDLVLSHPPYHNMIVYSGNVWGRAGHPDDLSRCGSEDEFLAKLTLAIKNQREATRAGGYYGAIIGDLRRGGSLFQLPSRPHHAHAEKGIAGGADQAPTLRRQQRQGLSLKAAAHYARIRNSVAAAREYNLRTAARRIGRGEASRCQ